MYILTQNKKNIIKVEHLQIKVNLYSKTKEYYIVNYEDDFIIGKYKTNEQAELILLEIMNSIIKGKNFFIMQ